MDDPHLTDSALSNILSIREAKRAEEAQTMLPTRRPTPDELQRAMVIAKWFYAWNSSCSPCPIAMTDSVWGKKLCSLFEWIAVLESEAKTKGQTQP